MRAGACHRARTWLRVAADVALQRAWVAGMAPAAPGAPATAYVGRGAPRGVEGAKRGADAVRGRTFVVTGATSGIGLETARALALAGAHVVLCCRTASKAHALIERWADEAGEQGVSCEVLRVDLSDLSSVRAAASALNERHTVHCLINNAGVFSMGAPRSETSDGHEAHLGTNCLAPFLLTLLALPALRRAGGGARVVNVASILHELAFDAGAMLADMQVKRSYSPLRAYAQSKLAEVMLTAELAERLDASEVSVVSLHPGNVVTDVVRTLPPLIQSAYRCVMSGMLLTPSEGARAQLHAATCEPRGAPRSGAHLGSDGCVCESNPLAADAALRRRVWDECERLCGLTQGEAAELLRASGS